MTDPTSQEAFGRRLRQLRREKSAREERDVEQVEVADAVGTKQSNVTRWEAGRVPGSEDMLRRLAQFYGVTVSWLRFHEGPREAPPQPVEVRSLAPAADAPASKAKPRPKKAAGRRR